MPYRGTLCAGYEVCPVRDCSAPVVPRQEEFSGAATVSLEVRYLSLGRRHLVIAINYEVKTGTSVIAGKTV